MDSSIASDNPLLQAWTTPHGMPPFEAIRAEHFAPAYEHALAAHRAEIDALAANPAQPTFENTALSVYWGWKYWVRLPSKKIAAISVSKVENTKIPTRTWALFCLTMRLSFRR